MSKSAKNLIYASAHSHLCWTFVIKHQISGLCLPWESEMGFHSIFYGLTPAHSSVGPKSRKEIRSMWWLQHLNLSGWSSRAARLPSNALRWPRFGDATFRNDRGWIIGSSCASQKDFDEGWKISIAWTYKEKNKSASSIHQVHPAKHEAIFTSSQLFAQSNKNKGKEK